MVSLPTEDSVVPLMYPLTSHTENEEEEFNRLLHVPTGVCVCMYVCICVCVGWQLACFVCVWGQGAEWEWLGVTKLSILQHEHCACVLLCFLLCCVVCCAALLRHTHTPPTGSTARPQARWVPYRHSNGLAIYRHHVRAADGEPPEYMVRLIGCLCVRDRRAHKMSEAVKAGCSSA